MSQAFQPRSWYNEDLQADSSWVLHLNEQEATGFLTALEHAKSLGKPMLSMTSDDFPLDKPSLAALQRAFAATQGRWGLCLVKGFPVGAWSAADARLAFWGMGMHVGVARTQNRASEIMNDVRNEGGSYKTKGGRGYNTNAALDFHADSCDVVGLLCLQPAKSGGQSKITSTMAVRDEIMRQRPDLIATLKGPFYHSYQGTQSPDQPPFYNCPILGSLPDCFAFRANRKNTNAAQQDFAEVPRLTEQQLEALALIDELTADPKLCYSMWLESGDLQLLNNYVVLHSRTEFEDFDEPDRMRHLLRLWLSIPQAQQLPPEWEEYFGDVRAGSVRGGVRGSYITPEFLEYEARQATRMHMALK